MEAFELGKGPVIPETGIFDVRSLQCLKAGILRTCLNFAIYVDNRQDRFTLQLEN